MKRVRCWISARLAVTALVCVTSELVSPASARFRKLSKIFIMVLISLDRARLGGQYWQRAFGGACQVRR